MSRSKSFQLTPLLFLAAFTAAAQDYRPNLLPPSPDAAALGKYADIPVGLYTGTLPLGIPLYTLKDGNLGVPVGLSYHASGNRIEEAATNAGLSWCLNAGGAIMRSVRNLPDDHPVKGFLDYSATYSLNYLENDPNRYTQWQEMASGCADAEPDAYFFNFNGFTGKFTFNWSGQVVTDSETAWKIEVLRQDGSNPDKITGWKFTGDEGTVYTFTTAEQTTITDNGLSCQAGLAFNSAWYLTSVRNPNATRTVAFTYENYTVNFDLLQSVTHRTYPANPAACQTTTPSPSNNFSKLVYSCRRVKTITSTDNAAVVTFNYLTARTDESGTDLKRLDEITVKNKDDAEIRKFTLGYDYSTGRLTLKSVKKTNTAEPPYQFQYHFEQLPQRSTSTGGTASFAQDHWGYYNGMSGNSSLLPSVWKPDGSGNMVYYKGGDRVPDAYKMTAGILTKIMYPAGAVDEFFYTPHEYGYIGNQPVSALGEYTLLEEVVDAPSLGGIAVGNQAHPAASPITVTDSDLIFGTTGAEANVRISWEGRETHSSPYGAYVEIYRSGNTVPLYKKEFTGTSLQKGTEYINLPYGEYVVKAVATHQTTIPHTGELVQDLARIALNWKTRKTTQNIIKKKTAGGLRIAMVSSYVHPGDPGHVTRVFQYSEPGPAAESSGVLNWNPKYEVPNLKYYAAGETACTYDLRIFQNKAMLGYGPHVAYRNVTELSGSNGSNGKTVYTFLSEFDYPAQTYDTAPLQMPTSSHHKTGNLLNESSYKKVSDSYQAVAEMAVTASAAIETNAVKGIKIRFDGGNSTAAKFSKGTYETRMGLWRATETVQKEYTSDGTASVENRRHFAYDNNMQYLKESRLYLNNNQAEYEQVKYYYANDFTSPATPVQTLVSKNMIGIPLETVKLRVNASGAAVTGAVYSKYTFDTRILLSEVKKLQLAEPSGTFDYAFDNSGGTIDTRYATETTFEKYDAKENLTQFTGKDGITGALLWDKHNTGPVASVSDAAPDKVAYSGFEHTDPVTFGGAWTLSGTYVGTDYATGKRCYQGTVTVNTTGFPATGYTLSFFMKGTGNFTVNGNAVPATAQWSVYETTVTGGSTVTVNSNGGLIDELRIYPAGAQMTSAAYDQLIAQNSVADVRSKPAFAEYDNLWRPHLFKDHNKDIVKRVTYEYDILSPPGYALTATQTGNHTYQFNVTGGSSGYTYEWDFDDLTGQNTGTASVNHTFPALSLKYLVKVNVKNGVNLVASLSTELLVMKQGGSTVCSEIQDITVTPGSSNPRSYTVSAPAISGAAYSWDFGDGSVPKPNANSAYLYANAGPYIVVLTVSVGSKSCSKSKSITVD